MELKIKPSKRNSLSRLVFSSLSLWANLLCIAAPVKADDAPLATANRTMLVRTLGLPSAESARWYAAATHRFTLHSELTSQFFIDDGGLEQARFDGETFTLNWRYRFTLNERIELGVDIPWLQHSGGSLDGFVNDWHGTFGLPEGRRDEFPKDQINFSVQSLNGSLALLQSRDGPGDVSAQIRARLPDAAGFSLSALLRVEAPSGNAADLLGSDTWDVAAGFLAYRPFQIEDGFRGVLNFSLGVVRAGDAGFLPAQQNDVVAYGLLAVSLPTWYESLSLKAQIETHSPFYDSEIKALGKPSLQLSFGASLQLSSHYSLDLGMSEDIAPRTAPDFSFLITLRYLP